MATLVGCNAELVARVNAIFAEDKLQKNVLWLSEGFRTKAEQEVLYAKAKKEHPKDYGRWAAKPGTSNHERGLAVDIGTVRPRYDDYAKALCTQNGLYQPLANEAWHWELSPTRQPLKTPVAIPKAVPVKPPVFGPTTKFGKYMRKEILLPKGDDKGYVDTGVPFAYFVNAFEQSLSPDRDGWDFSDPSVKANNFNGQVRLVIKNNTPPRDLNLVVVWDQ